MNNHPLQAEADRLFDQGQLIKAGKVREVKRNGDIFLKLDRRKHTSFKREYKCAIRLKNCGIPVTEPLFYTRTVRGNYLATKAFNGIAVDEYLKNNMPEPAFFRQAAELLLKMLDANFIHTDFHLGNLLYSPENKTFSLVDVDAVKKIPSFIKKLLPVHLKFHLLTEFRGWLTKKELLELFAFAGVPDGEKLYCATFIRDAAHILRTWERRKQQILEGYKKFTYCIDGDLFDSDAKDEEFAGTESLSSGRSIFLAHFYLKLIKIPHRKVLRFSPAAGEILIAGENTTPAPEAEAQEMVERLRFYGIETDIGDWRKVPGGLPELNAVEKVATQPFIM